MPRKKATTVSKAEFIRSMPLTMPVAEVIAKANDQGIKLTEGYVQTTRSSLRKVQLASAQGQQQSLPFEAATAAQVAKLVQTMGPVKAKARLSDLVDMANAVLKAVGS